VANVGSHKWYISSSTCDSTSPIRTAQALFKAVARSDRYACEMMVVEALLNLLSGRGTIKSNPGPRLFRDPDCFYK
jgi:hypothetical protein